MIIRFKTTDKQSLEDTITESKSLRHDIRVSFKKVNTYIYISKPRKQIFSCDYFTVDMCYSSVFSTNDGQALVLHFNTNDNTKDWTETINDNDDIFSVIKSSVRSMKGKLDLPFILNINQDIQNTGHEVSITLVRNVIDYKANKLKRYVNSMFALNLPECELEDVDNSIDEKIKALEAERKELYDKHIAPLDDKINKLMNNI